MLWIIIYITLLTGTQQTDFRKLNTCKRGTNMDGVKRLAQMNEVERMREVMDILSDSMQKQND